MNGMLTETKASQRMGSHNSSETVFSITASPRVPRYLAEVWLFHSKKIQRFGLVVVHVSYWIAIGLA